MFKVPKSENRIRLLRKFIFFIEKIELKLIVHKKIVQSCCKGFFSLLLLLLLILIGLSGRGKKKKIA